MSVDTDSSGWLFTMSDTYAMKVIKTACVCSTRLCSNIESSILRETPIKRSHAPSMCEAW